MRRLRSVAGKVVSKHKAEPRHKGALEGAGQPLAPVAPAAKVLRVAWAAKVAALVRAAKVATLAAKVAALVRAVLAAKVAPVRAEPAKVALVRVARAKLVVPEVQGVDDAATGKPDRWRVYRRIRVPCGL